MGQFLDLIRGSASLSPRRLGFTVARWAQAFAAAGAPDGEDSSLYAAGLALFNKMAAIRQASAALPLAKLSRSTRLRAYVAMANADVARVGDKAKSATVAALRAPDPGSDMSLLSEALRVKVQTRDGTSWYPGELVEGIVDGMQIPIAIALSEAEGDWGPPRMGDVPWEAVAAELNLGVTYRFAEDLWDDCLWNGYAMTEHAVGKVFGPTQPTFQQAQAIGITRRHAISMSASLLGMEARRTIDALNLPPRVRPVIGIRRDGKRQVVQLGSASGAVRSSSTLWTLRALATEPYYEGLLEEPVSLLEGLSLTNVLDAWMVVAQTSRFLQDRLERADSTGGLGLADFAPTVQADALAGAISAAAGVRASGARKLLDFLTFRGRSGQELWAQPLVPVGDRVLSPVFGALEAPSLRRVVDVWLRQLGIDLARRGPAFEQYVRDEVVKGIEGSRHLRRNAGCVPLGFTFHSGADASHELDLVFAIGNTVFVGECKCILEPTDAKSIAMHRKTVLEAAEQARLRVDAIRAHRQRFTRQISTFGVELTGDFDVVPLVVLSTTAHVGVPAAGVPVIDILILSRFLEGYIETVAVTGEERTVAREAETYLYADAAHAEAIAPSYFERPPQILPYAAGVEPRVVPLHPAGPEDWTGSIIVLDCRPDVKPLPAGLLDLDAYTRALGRRQVDDPPRRR